MSNIHIMSYADFPHKHQCDLFDSTNLFKNIYTRPKETKKKHSCESFVQTLWYNSHIVLI